MGREAPRLCCSRQLVSTARAPVLSLLYIAFRVALSLIFFPHHHGSGCSDPIFIFISISRKSGWTTLWNFHAFFVKSTLVRGAITERPVSFAPSEADVDAIIAGLREHCALDRSSYFIDVGQIEEPLQLQLLLQVLTRLSLMIEVIRTPNVFQEDVYIGLRQMREEPLRSRHYQLPF